MYCSCTFKDLVVQGPHPTNQNQHRPVPLSPTPYSFYAELIVLKGARRRYLRTSAKTYDDSHTLPDNLNVAWFCEFRRDYSVCRITILRYE